jgi:hypothetical protein
MSQTFKNTIPEHLFFHYLSNVCTLHNNSYYIFDKSAYKKGELNNENNLFCNYIKEYYYKSKQHYIERKNSYKKFTTIIRQICKYNSYNFNSKLIYNSSDYEIVYWIFHNKPNMHDNDTNDTNDDVENENN